MGYKGVTSGLLVANEWVTSGLQMGYEFVTSGLQVRYEWVRSGYSLNPTMTVTTVLQGGLYSMRCPDVLVTKEC